MKVIVLGAGVMGVTTAYFLARAGYQVTVIEKNSSAGVGCSYANGGQLSYSHIETWAAKTSLFSMIKAAIFSNSFLSFSDYSNKDFWRWFLSFYGNSYSYKAHKNSKKLFTLSSYSKELLSEILGYEKDLKFNQQNSGILHFYRNDRRFNAAIKEAEFHSSIGCNVRVFNPKECVKKEPTLIKLFDKNRLAGGVFYEMDSSGDCFLFTQGLEKICREKYEVVFEYNTEVKNILTNYKKITGINTSAGVFTADKYICTLGATGINLLKGVGVDTKIYPLKGYSLSIPCNKGFTAPNISMTDPENKIVYSRIGNIFRAAGSVEICGFNDKANQKHLNFLKDTVSESFSDFGNFSQLSEWFGFRPFRPNSLPLICEVKKYGNLLLNTGHGSLGWTLSTASGKIITDLVSSQRDSKLNYLDYEV